MKRHKESHLSLLIQACMDNDIVKVEELVVSGQFRVTECRDHRGRSPLHLAAYRGNVDMISVLLENGGDLWTRDDNGNTLMHLCNHLQVIKMVAKRGLSPFERNANGETPLMLAMRFGASKDVLDLLKKLEQNEVEDEPPVNCPLFNSNHTYKSLQDDNNSSTWTNESFRELGLYKIVFVLFLIALLSLYITYCIIGELPLNTPLLNSIAGHEEQRYRLSH